MRRKGTLLTLFLVAVSVSILAITGPEARTSSITVDPDPIPGLEPKSLVVMNLAAHPDDEDGRTLAYYRWAKNAAAYSVIYTRGEGGQNEIGPELYEELGALRTDETERAARILGTQIYFLNYSDFGFSKFAYEAFDKWGGRDAVTARLVYLVRKLKPDVMFTNHDTVTVGQTQHGQHQAVGISAYDAFELAADPQYHPEQLLEPGVDLWQPKRLFLRSWRRPDSFDAAVPVDAIYDPKGMSYADIAGDALVEHASQGMGVFAGRRSSGPTYFTLLRSATDAPLDSDDLASNLPPQDRYPDLEYYIDAGYLPVLPADKIRVDDSIAVPGQKVRFNIDGEAGTETKLYYRGIPILTDDNTFIVPETDSYTYPKESEQYNRFLNSYPFSFVQYRDGTLVSAGYLPVEIARPLVIEDPGEVFLIAKGPNRFPLKARSFDPQIRRVQFDWKLSTKDGILASGTKTVEANNSGLFETEVMAIMQKETGEEAYTLTVNAHANSGTNGGVFHSREFQARSVQASVVPDLRVGIISSYDDTMERAMKVLDVSYRMLDSTDLANGRFDDLNTIVIDIRAYLVRKDLRENNQKLLDWVENGGHLIVNYHKTMEWNEGGTDPFDTEARNPQFAPYPLRLGRDRVTFETAPVRLLQPDHPLLHYPNEIEARDWEGWIQERGLYFPEQYDEHYQELFEMSDPGDTPLRGSTLLANYGKGTYLYSALVWYRQLKELHPGAFKIFANMLSLPVTDA